MFLEPVTLATCHSLAPPAQASRSSMKGGGASSLHYKKVSTCGWRQPLLGEYRHQTLGSIFLSHQLSQPLSDFLLCQDWSECPTRGSTWSWYAGCGARLCKHAETERTVLIPLIICQALLTLIHIRMDSLHLQNSMALHSGKKTQVNQSYSFKKS